MRVRSDRVRACAFKGAVFWEAQVAGLWVKVPFWRYRKSGTRTMWGWDKDRNADY